MLASDSVYNTMQFNKRVLYITDTHAWNISEFK
jgi:hypothetical protein